MTKRLSYVSYNRYSMGTSLPLSHHLVVTVSILGFMPRTKKLVEGGFGSYHYEVHYRERAKRR